MFRQLWLIAALLIFSSRSFADYGWLPKDKVLFSKVGFDYLRTSENFEEDGSIEELGTPGSGAYLSSFKLWTEHEYGFGPDWSLWGRFQFVSNSFDDSTPTGGLSGSGLGDIWMGIKRNVKSAHPSITLELKTKIPTYSNFIRSLDELVLGDGNVDIGLAGHLGLGSGPYFVALSPELLFRFGGYSSGFVFKGAAGARFSVVYMMLTTQMFASFSNALLFDSSSITHDAGGTGGSYALLSGDPFGFDMGLKGGIRLGKSTFFELSFTRSFFGKRYPNFYQVGLNLFVMTDFTVPDTRPRIHEVPFESSQEPPAYPAGPPPQGISPPPA